MKKNVYVLPSGSQWIVRAAEDNEAMFQSLYDAETFGRRVAREEKSEFFIYAKDGTIQRKDSYENHGRYPH
jgi:hypothetical protein